MYQEVVAGAYTLQGLVAGSGNDYANDQGAYEASDPCLERGT